VAIAAAAQERPAAPSDYRQTAAVLAHYPAVTDMHLDSPAFRTAEPSLTSQEAMAAFLADLAGGSQKAKLGSIGRSTRGRDIPSSISRPRAWRPRDPPARPAGDLADRPAARQRAGRRRGDAGARSALAKGDSRPCLPR
jgi:hypothetical protein